MEYLGCYDLHCYPIEITMYLSKYFLLHGVVYYKNSHSLEASTAADFKERTTQIRTFSLSTYLVTEIWTFTMNTNHPRTSKWYLWVIIIRIESGILMQK